MLLDYDVSLKFGIELSHIRLNGYTAWTSTEVVTRIYSTLDVIFKLSMMFFLLR
jgi:hypothetical protein